MSDGGAYRLVHSVRMLLEENSDFVCITNDSKIAYNECMRATAVDKLMKEQTLAHLEYYAAVRFTPHKCVWVHPLCQDLISLWGDKLPFEGIEPWALVDQIGVALASSYPNLIVGDRP